MVCGIINECGEQMFMDDGLLHWATPLTHDFIRKECIEKHVFLAVSKQARKAVATFNLDNRANAYFDIDAKAFYMQRLAVLPKCWNKGIGTRCYNFAVERASEYSLSCIRSSVYEASGRAVSFLKRRGYHELYRRHSRNFAVLCMESENGISKKEEA